jgi:ATP-dependent DNA helicase RecG
LGVPATATPTLPLGIEEEHPEALAALERVIQMDAPPTRHAWAWFNLGQARQWLRAPRQDVIAAYGKACALAPDEDRLQKALAQARGGA